MATVDVTVRGAGIFGLSVAFACARRGAAVRVIDPRGVAAGASGGLVGALAPHVPENWNAKKAFQFAALIEAEAFWAGVAQIAGEDPGYIRSGRLQPLADAKAVELAQARARTAAELWEGKAAWCVEAAPEGPWTVASATGLVIRDTLSAHLHPRRATSALAKAVVALGGEIVSEGPEAGAVVQATGWEGLTEIGGVGVKGQAALLAFDAKGAPQLFAEVLHLIPHLDGTVAIGSTTEREWDSPDAPDAQLDEVIARARAAVPALAGAPVLSRWAGVRPRSRSRAPVLGPHPARPGQFIANGGFKIGFAMAPRAGAVMADLVLDGHDTIPDDFRA